MANATLEHGAVEHGLPGAYEAPLFGAYSKKVGMWLFLASDSLTFGALLFAFSYNRIYTTPWPTPFHAASIANATIMTACLLSSSLTMVMAVFAAQRGDRAWTRNWLLATMVFGTAFIVLHGMEWTKLIGEGLTIPGFPKPASAAAGELADISKNVPQFPATFFGLTAMHMLHVTIGVIYLGVVAFRKWFLPVLACLLDRGIFSDSFRQRFSLRNSCAGPGLAGCGGDPVPEAERLRCARCGSVGLVLALRRSGVDVYFPVGVFDVDQDQLNNVSRLYRSEEPDHARCRKARR